MLIYRLSLVFLILSIPLYAIEPIPSSCKTELATNLFREQLAAKLSDLQQQYASPDVQPSNFFKRLLDSILPLTESDFGFVAKVENRNQKTSFDLIAVSDIRDLESAAANDLISVPISEHTLEELNRYPLFYPRNPGADISLFHAAFFGKDIVKNTEDECQSLHLGIPHPPLKSIAILPLIMGGSVVGILGLTNRPGGYSQDFIHDLQPVTWASSVLILAYRNLRSRDEAQSQRTRLGSIIKASPYFVCMMDPKGHIQYFNPAGRKMLGIDLKEDVRTSKLSDFHSLSAIAFLTQHALPEAIQNGSWMGENSMRTRHGKEIPVTQVLVAHKDSSNQLKYISMLALDTSERAKAEENLRKAHEDLKSTQEQMLRQERLRAFGEMASGIAHAFNNQLSPIVGYSELLAGNDHLPEDARKQAKIISSAANGAKEIIIKLQKLYRQEEPQEAHKIALHAVIKDVVDLVRPRLRQAALNGSHIEISIEGQSKPVPKISGRIDQIQDLLLNLLFNAIDAMPEGGRIVLKTRLTQKEVEVDILDSGKGMTAEVQNRCLEPYFTTKGPKGTGLGLSMCHEIVTRHGGSLKIISQPGKGTKVILSFPRPPESGEKPAPRIPTPSETRNQKSPSSEIRNRRYTGKVLLIDDQIDVLKLNSHILRGIGFTVDTAGSGKHGLKAITENRYDLIITDMGMDGINGAAIVSYVKRAHIKTPIMVLSGWAAEDIQKHMVEAPNYIAQKPITPDKLISLIDKLLFPKKK